MSSGQRGLLLGILCSVIMLGAAPMRAEARPQRGGAQYYIFNGRFDKEFVASGQMGDGLTIKPYRVSGAARRRPVMECVYAIKPAGVGWGGVYWMHPANNWGSSPGSAALSGKNRLRFWLKGAVGGEVFTVRVGGIQGTYSDGVDFSVTIRATPEWQLKEYVIAGDLSAVIGGFCLIATQLDNPTGARIYLQDIMFEPVDALVSVRTAAPPEFAAAPKPYQQPERVYLYADFHSSLFIPSGWMGDTNNLNYNERHRDNPYRGKTCVHVTYANRRSWAGIYWLYPADNWGNEPGTDALAAKTALVFHARGRGTVKFGLGGIDGRHRDSGKAEETVRLSEEWRQYRLVPERGSLQRMIGGFYFSVSGEDNPRGVDFYLDDIYYE